MDFYGFILPILIQISMDSVYLVSFLPREVMDFLKQLLTLSQHDRIDKNGINLNFVQKQDSSYHDDFIAVLLPHIITWHFFLWFDLKDPKMSVHFNRFNLDREKLKPPRLGGQEKRAPLNLVTHPVNDDNNRHTPSFFISPFDDRRFFLCLSLTN